MTPTTTVQYHPVMTAATAVVVGPYSGVDDRMVTVQLDLGRGMKRPLLVQDIDDIHSTSSSDDNMINLCTEESGDIKPPLIQCTEEAIRNEKNLFEVNESVHETIPGNIAMTTTTIACQGIRHINV